MATATSEQGKTSFVKQFLNNHPDGTTRTVNEAWRAAGFDGTISPTLVNKTRVKLTGKRRGKARNAAGGKIAARGKATAKPSKTDSTPGKTLFVKEFLNDHPQGNTQAVNEAWTAAGFKGTISRTLVDKTKALLGLTGTLRGNSQETRKATKEKATPSGRKRGRPRKETTAAVNAQPPGSKSSRTAALTDLEADIDRLIFKIMGIGDLTQIEDSLRHVRRLLYVQTSGR